MLGSSSRTSVGSLFAILVLMKVLTHTVLITGNAAPTELPPVVEPSPADDPFASSGPIDWAEEVEQELFGASSDPIFSETKPEDEANDSDDSDDEILMIVPIEDRRFVASGAGYTLYTISEVDEKDGEKDGAEEPELDITDQANLTSSPTTNSTLAPTRTITLADIRPPMLLFGNESIRDIEANDYYDDRIALDHDELDYYFDDDAASKVLYGAIQYLSAMSLLRLDTYTRFFGMVARMSLIRPSFWFSSSSTRDVDMV